MVTEKCGFHRGQTPISRLSPAGGAVHGAYRLPLLPGALDPSRGRTQAKLKLGLVKGLRLHRLPVGFEQAQVRLVQLRLHPMEADIVGVNQLGAPKELFLFLLRGLGQFPEVPLRLFTDLLEILEGEVAEVVGEQLVAASIVYQVGGGGIPQ